MQFTRIQATIILVTVLVICGLSVPDFISDETIGRWPEWAQRRITLAPELQGGTSVLLEVDRNDVRDYLLKKLSREVHDLVRDAHIGLASPMATRGGSVEVRPLAADFEAALAKLGELSQAFNGVRPVDVTDAADGLIRLTPTEAAVQEYAPLIADRRVGDIRARLFGAPGTVERDGAWRIRVQLPRLGIEALNRVHF